MNIEKPNEYGFSEKAGQIKPCQNSRGMNIDLLEVFYMMVSYLGKIIFCALLGVATAFFYTCFYISPTYTASSSIYIVSVSNNAVINVSDLQLGCTLFPDYHF